LESKETEREIFGNRYATLEKEYEQYRYKSVRCIKHGFYTAFSLMLCITIEQQNE
jgi:hypothetical protein